MAERKHWLDVVAIGISLLSLGVSGLTAYRTVLFQRDDVRLIVGPSSLAVTRSGKDLMLAQDQQFTFINAGNRQAVITEMYAELLPVTDLGKVPHCGGRLAKSIILNPTQFVLKPAEITPVSAKVVQGYPWEKANENFRFREDGATAALYLVCLHLYVTTQDSSHSWVQPLYTVPEFDAPPVPTFDPEEPLKVIQRTRWGF